MNTCADCQNAVIPTAASLAGYRQCAVDTRPFAMAMYVPAKWKCQWTPSRFVQRSAA